MFLTYLFTYLLIFTANPVEESEGGEKYERSCDRLIMCIITTLNQGLRNGGGIGDVLRKPSSDVSLTSSVLTNVQLYTLHLYSY